MLIVCAYAELAAANRSRHRPLWGDLLVSQLTKPASPFRGLSVRLQIPDGLPTFVALSVCGYDLGEPDGIGA